MLHILADGEYNGLHAGDREFREMFTREYLMESDWYQERLEILTRQFPEEDVDQRLHLTSDFTLLGPLRFHLFRAVRLRGAVFFAIQGQSPWTAVAPPAPAIIPTIMPADSPCPVASPIAMESEPSCWGKKSK